MKVRLRFGIRLPWPVANAGTFVRHMTQDQADKVSSAFGLLILALNAAGASDIAAKLFCEAS